MGTGELRDHPLYIVVRQTWMKRKGMRRMAESS
jgi:hypothetical protein